MMRFYEAELQRLYSLYQKNKMHSALLISGAEASRIDVFCKHLAHKILNIPVEKEFCPDVKIIKYDETKAQKVISVDNIRSINNFMQHTSYGGGEKIVIINSVNNLNKNSANALLKILEEPPKNSYFFLICHNLDNVLDTIKSRTINITLPRLRFAESVNILGNKYDDLDPAIINNAAQIFPSSIEYAEQYIEEKMDKIYEKIAGLNNNSHAIDIEELISKLDLKHEFTFSVITKIIYDLCHQRLIPKKQTVDLFSNNDETNANIINQPAIHKFIDSFTTELNELLVYNLDKVNFLRIYLTKFKAL